MKNALCYPCCYCCCCYRFVRQTFHPNSALWEPDTFLEQPVEVLPSTADRHPTTLEELFTVVDDLVAQTETVIASRIEMPCRDGSRPGAPQGSEPWPSPCALAPRC